MSVSDEEIQALVDAVSQWRMQEYIMISSYAFYVYYTLTTMDKETSIIHPQKWNRGKLLYMVVRYGAIVYIALHLSRDYRNYYSIDMVTCKGLLIAHVVIYWLVLLACDVSLGLCLGALLQARKLYVMGIVLLSVAMPFISFITLAIGDARYPAEPISELDEALGYACYVPLTSEELGGAAIVYVGLEARAYINLAVTAVLVVIAISTLVSQYKGQSGRLVQVVRRDGGLYYLSLLAIRLSSAILLTPAIIPSSSLESNPGYILVSMANDIVIPILAQRLMTNMRKVDYIGTQPFASKLLFAAPAPGSEDDFDDDLGSSLETPSEPASSRYTASSALRGLNKKVEV